MQNINRSVCAKRLIIGLLSMTLFACFDQEQEKPPVSEKKGIQPSETIAKVLGDSALEHAKKHLDPKYVCPMHPQIVRDEEGSCPICGMDLVKKMIDSSKGKRPVVEVSSAVIQNMGVKTDYAKHDTLWKFIRTVGYVDYDETKLEHMHPRTEGWLEKLNFRAEGEPVEKGEILGYLYSPEILAAQVDFLIALDQPGAKKNKARIEKARNRLRLLGVTEGTISRIQKRRKSQNNVPIISAASGIMTKLTAREGMYIKPDMEIFTIADLGRMWVIVEVFEHQIDWLASGLTAEITVPAYPGRVWEGQVEYIYPDLNPKSRTLRVRLAFDNPEGLLKANMFAEAVIYGGPKHNALVVPSNAVIVTGERSTVVKALGDGRFEPVDVVTGMVRNGRTEILNGLKEADEIVVAGQFLIDSESSLQASFQRMGE